MKGRDGEKHVLKAATCFKLKWLKNGGPIKQVRKAVRRRCSLAPCSGGGRPLNMNIRLAVKGI